MGVQKYGAKWLKFLVTGALFQILALEMAASF
jgi:hypothetical protein